MSMATTTLARIRHKLSLQQSPIASMGKTAIPTTILLLAALAFHFAAPTMWSQVSCGCSKQGHEVGISCNCPGCLAQRATPSCCSFKDKTISDERKSAVPSLKPLRCTCGSQDPIATSKGPLPFIPCSGPEPFMISPAGSVDLAEILLSLEEVDLSLDRPG